MELLDTIAAIATPPGEGGLAVIRISGPQAYEVAARVFVPRNTHKKLAAAKGYTALLGDLLAREVPVDEGIALCFRAPHSYTGEDVVELSCHGGRAVSEAVLSACIAAGARPAGPGEFTRRALLHGRITLTQAEAVLDLISARSRQGAAAAKAALSGAMNSLMQQQKQTLARYAAHLSACLDFPEEDLPDFDEQGFAAALQQAIEVFARLVNQYESGQAYSRGLRAAIVGSPNVGKSTLFNLLAGFERSIVTPVAGTTRDVVTQQVVVGGIPLTLADTAGLRETQDLVETLGIKRSYDEIEQADFVIAVFDGSQPLTAEDDDLARHCAGLRALALINKGDLPLQVAPEALQPYFGEVLVVSAHNTQTRDLLATALKKAACVQDLPLDQAMLANERQFSAASRALEALHNTDGAIKSGVSWDAVLVDLHEVLEQMASISGESLNDAIIDELFDRFCIGK